MLLVKEKGNIYVFQEDRWWKTTFELPRAGKVSSFNRNSFKEEGEKKEIWQAPVAVRRN